MSNCILQIEDEQADIELIRFVFKRAGITNPIRTATDGQMALDYLFGIDSYADRQKYPMPCLILLDLKLPKLSGLEVLARIRQQPGIRRLPVIIFSSSAQPADLERAYDLGANSFIQKPTALEVSLEIAQHLKDWWLTHNRVAPID